VDKLNYRYQLLLRGLETLSCAVEDFKLAQQKKDLRAYCSMRDSLVQRFEYSIELTWKYLAKYLQAKHLKPETMSSVEVIRTCCSMNLLSQSEAESLLNMIKSRNKTSHLYIEELAQELASIIPGYYDVMIVIAHRIVPSK
jgi:nucleotidyltransferase substrate binding protein (TIGR01987 family)